MNKEGVKKMEEINGGGLETLLGRFSLNDLRACILGKISTNRINGVHISLA